MRTAPLRHSGRRAQSTCTSLPPEPMGDLQLVYVALLWAPLKKSHREWLKENFLGYNEWQFSLKMASKYIFFFFFKNPATTSSDGQLSVNTSKQD